MHLLKFKRKIKAGDTYRFSIAGTSITSAHDEDPLNAAERLTIFAKLQGADRLIAFHEKAWNDIWKADIQIEGDPQTQQDIHSMLYHLYSFTREGTTFSLSPMGLSGLGYNGHVFWDADLWMFPPLLILHPEMARSMIEYRYERLDAARKNAFAHGYKGAMFPWESAASGVEETPVWALSGPFEHHITACVGLAAWNYYCVTQDKNWLREKGWPILSATADFWASRVERNGPGKYDIRNVVAADEWAENVDNNAFTNGAAKVLLQHATEAAGILGMPADPDWMVVSENIPILQLNGITREHGTYNGEGIKQADVNLLAYPLKLITDPVQVKKDLVYYQSRVPNQETTLAATLLREWAGVTPAVHVKGETNPEVRAVLDTIDVRADCTIITDPVGDLLDLKGLEPLVRYAIDHSREARGSVGGQRLVEWSRQWVAARHGLGGVEGARRDGAGHSMTGL
jgi:trehalose/maltose hydrolase-like predicted phosphorylase